MFVCGAELFGGVGQKAIISASDLSKYSESETPGFLNNHFIEF